MTRMEYEALRRQRQRQNIIAIGILVAITALIITAVVLILRPHGPQEDVAANAVVTSAPSTVATVEPTAGASPSEAPAATDGEASAGTETSSGLRSVRMRVTGDIMVSEEQLSYAKVGSTYDFHNQFALISDVLQDADYTMGNLETTVGKYNNKA